MKKLSIILGLSFCGILFCALFVDPNKLSPVQFVPIVFLVYVWSASLVAVLIKLFTEHVQRQKLLFISCVLALTPTILFSLMTLGRIAAIDIVLSVALPSLVAWYGLRIKNF